MPFNDLIHPALGQYRSAVAAPADFDSFWQSTIAEARAAGGAATFTAEASPISLLDIFDVTFPGFGGHPVKGWLVLPKARPEKLPLVVQYVGYGGGRGMAHEALHFACSGFAYFRMDTRGQGSGWSVGETPDPVGSTPQVPGVMTKGILDPNDYYYRRVYTDAVRAIDALIDQDWLDPARIAVIGGSQGGGITLAVAGLDPRIAAAAPDVPFLCDFPRAVRLAARDPYGEISRFLAMQRDKVSTVFANLSYFDGVNFAARAKAPALFSAGLMDNVCPPSTVYAAYNAYAGTKSILDYEFNDHEGGGALHELRRLEWLKQVLSA